MSARGPKIKPSLLKLINLEALRYREKPREALAVELKDTIEKMGEISPDIETIKRKISYARNHESPLDATWTLSTLRDYPIEPIAIQKILELKAKGLEWLSIRTAQWISRLSALALSVDMLYYFAFLYSLAEQANELSDPITDTSSEDIDALLLSDLQNPKIAMRDVSRYDEEVPKEFEEEFIHDIGKRILLKAMEKKQGVKNETKYRSH